MPKRTHMPRAQQSLVINPLLTIEDVQRILSLSKPKVYELMNTRGLPSVKIDGVRRFEPEALQAWIAQHRDVS
jgi:excisionase family DNA binding protein